MRPRHTSVTAVVTAAVATLAIVATAAPSQAGPPGTWTAISGGGVRNIDRAGMYRTADGVLHVAMHRDNVTSDSIDVAHISASGKLTGRTPAVDGWSGTTSDPILVGAPGGGMRLVFGGIRSLSASDPYVAGYLWQATAAADGASWGLDPNAAVAANTGYASSGTGVTTLADGTLAAAYPQNTSIHFQIGANAPSGWEIPECCAYDMSLASDGLNVWAAWYANGSAGTAQGIFVRQIHPVLGPITQAPGSVVSTGTGPESLNPDQAIGMVYRPGDGLYLAYLKGYPTAKGITLWKYGTSATKTVPGSKGADHVAMSLGPAGRIWLAWDDASDQVHAVRTSPKGLTFGAVQDLEMKGSPTVYAVNIEGSAGRGDIVINDATKIWHTQVLPGLSLKASPKKWAAGTSEKVTFKVTDAGDAVKNAVVKAKGEKCTTDQKGICSITFPKLGRDRFEAVAKKDDYAAGSVRLKVR